MSLALLDAHDVSVEIPTPAATLRIVKNATLTVERGESVAIVGESGAGKSTLANAIIGYLRPPARVATGSVRFEGKPVVDRHASRRNMQAARIGYIVSNPASHLDPMRRIGDQIADMYRLHGMRSSADARRAAIDALKRLNIPDAERLARVFPHQISGGMAQRVVIAIALANDPELLIADEPVSGLDVTLQRQIMAEISRQAKERAAGVLLITHDLGLAVAYCERVLVMYRGEIIEDAPCRTFFGEGPAHPYSKQLLAAVAGEGP